MIKGRVLALAEHSRVVRAAIDASLKEINGIKGDPRSFDRLKKLLEDQAFRPSFWHVAADAINYRRFFDINELAAIRVEEPEIFEAVHGFTLRLAQQGLITGLRIDHVDRLLDPGLYLRLLQKRYAEAQAGNIEHRHSAIDSNHVYRRFYIIVEKILTGLERWFAARHLQGFFACASWFSLWRYLSRWCARAPRKYLAAAVARLCQSSVDSRVASSSRKHRQLERSTEDTSCRYYLLPPLLRLLPSLHDIPGPPRFYI